MGPTRARDLVAVAVVAGLVGYALTRFNYNSIPQLPRLAGVTAALLGIGEAVAGWGLRRRIRPPRSDDPSEPPRRSAERSSRRPPVPPLMAARVLRVAKASALAGAALIGLWVGFGAYVLPNADRAVVPAADTSTAIVGVVCAGVLLLGALWLEYCCRAPDDEPPAES